MRRIFDTSCLIEILIGSPTGELIKPLFNESHEKLIPTIIRVELMQWAGQNLTHFSTNNTLLPSPINVNPYDPPQFEGKLSEVSLILHDFYDNFLEVPLSAKVADYAGELSINPKYFTPVQQGTKSRNWGIADRVIYATAQLTNSELITCDNDFRGLPKVIVIDKAKY